MAEGSFTADTNTSWFRVNSDSGVRVSAKGTYGGGTITLQQYFPESEQTFSMLDETQTAITFSANFDDFFNLRDGDVFRLSLSGATSPTIYWFIGGAAEPL